MNDIDFMREAQNNQLNYRLNFFLIKTHGSVSCGPRKWGTHKLREYIDRKN